MHELSIVESLLEQVLQETQRVGAKGRVRRLELIIGRLSGVNCDSVRFAFDMLARDTFLENADLIIREPDASCRCCACLGQTEIEEFVAECPRCGSRDIVIEGGRQLLLQSIEVEESP
jgi:hydrogenase nickel incorporation protein HypA/HybF